MPASRAGGAPWRPLWPRGSLALLAVAATLLAGCAGGPATRDGPGNAPPPDLDRVPDAVPRVEPLRIGGPNKPYSVLGRTYVPLAEDRPLREVGGASWYGAKFHGRPTALGETYDMYAMTAAHKTMPLPSYARVRDPATGREIVVRVNDRGPFVDGRVIDLSYTAALRLGVLRGVTPVEVERLTHAEIRSGRWRRDGGNGPDVVAVGPTMAAAVPPQAPFDVPVDGRLQAPSDTTFAASVGEDATLAAAGSGWWLQLGAFRDAAGAAQLQRLLQAEAGWLAARTRAGGGWSRVQAGPFATRADAEAAAARLRDALPLDALVLPPR